MKNLHLIKTKGLNRNKGVLFADSLENDKLVRNFYDTNIEWKDCAYYHIYITNDEKPKKGEWSIYLGLQKKYKVIEDIVGDEFPKIILTTDPDLIKDGVQQIDDVFLDWFVNNPSCEEVKVVKGFDDGTSYGYNFLDYKIIIPKEEPISFPFFDKEKADAITKEGQKVIRELQSSMKQELNLNCFDCNKSLQDCTCMEDTIDMKQETLEEAADKLFPSCGKPLRKIAQKGFIAGAKWQTEKMYSEKEVLNILNEFCDNFYENSIREDIIIKWFEQFKKKA